MARAPIYREQGYSPLKDKIHAAEDLLTPLYEDIPRPIWDQLMVAFEELREADRAQEEIVRGSMKMGWGVNKMKRQIACEQAIAIIRTIKSAKGW